MTEEHIRASHRLLLGQRAGGARGRAPEGSARGDRAGKFEFTRHCNDSPGRRGRLGYFGRGMVPEFEDVVFNMQPGEVSDVFKTRFGLHIAKVTDHSCAPPLRRREGRRHLYEQENAPDAHGGIEAPGHRTRDA